MPKNAGKRGFVILIVLAVAAVITAVVAAQLISSSKAQVGANRATEEAKARAIAEACLDEFTAYAQDMVPDAGPGSDFDNLLAGKDHTTGNGSTAGAGADDFLPGVTTRRVLIPPTAPNNQLHMWELVDVSPGSGGLCAVRFDDNSDDARDDLPGGGAATGVGEGPTIGGDNPYKDRDLSVYVSVIGMFPVLGGTADANAYQSAHARVTLRRLIQKANVTLPLAAALWATNINLKNNNDICGAGGIEATGSVQMANNSCACGNSFFTTSTSCTGAGCPSSGQTCPCTGGCPPASVSTGAPQAPPINVHWGQQTTFLSPEVLGPPTRAFPTDDPPPGPPAGTGQGSTIAQPPLPASAYNVANPNICVLYGSFENAVTAPAPSDSEPRLYIWDRSDADALLSLETAANGGTVPPRGTILTNAATATVTNCTTEPAAAALPPPCNWDPTNATVANRLFCTAAQSPCWKLIGRFSPTTSDAVVGIDGTTTGWNRAVGFGGTTGPEFHTKKGVAIPNVFTAGSNMFGPANRLCGAPTQCSSCTSLGPGNFNGGNETISIPGLITFDHWHIDKGQNEFSPVPYVLFAKKLPGGGALFSDVHIFNAGDSFGALHASFVTDGGIHFDQGGVCCATCDCSKVATNNDIAGACQLDGSLGGGANPNVAAEATANAGNFDYSNNTAAVSGAWTHGNDNRGEVGGIVGKAGGTIRINTDKTLIGDVRGDLVDINATGCYIGSAIGYNGPGGANCGGGSAPCADPSVCLPNDAKWVGDIHSMSDIDTPGNNPRVYGNMAAKGSVCFKNNAGIAGTVQAGGTIEFKNNAKIVNNSSISGGTPTSANPALTSFMEASW